jgi:Flp pilus assembly protein TadG
MRAGSKSSPRPRHPLRRDRRGAAAVESALVVYPFLMLLFMVIQLGLFFVVQSALDVGVLATAESLRASLLANSSYAIPSATTLATTITADGGSLLAAYGIVVDVRQISTLSTSAPAVPDGTTAACGSGSVLILRAQASLPFLPLNYLLRSTSTSIVRCPWVG